MAKDLDEILKHASSEVLDINSGLIQDLQNRGSNKIAKSQKYGNRKVVFDGRKFDSKAEARHYMGLKALQELGHICNLECQPQFVLQEAFTDNDGKKVRAITYKADFTYYDNRDGYWYIVDVKSPPTSKETHFRCIWRMLQYQYRNASRLRLRIIIT